MINNPLFAMGTDLGSSIEDFIFNFISEFALAMEHLFSEIIDQG